MKAISGVLIASLAIAGCGGGGGGEDGFNTAPEISGRPADLVRAGEAYSFTPKVTDSDGDLLTFGVENLPDWAFFDAGSGQVTGFPDKTHYGSYDDIVIKVSDGIEISRFNFSLDVLPPLLGRDNFTGRGLVELDPNNSSATGSLVMNVDGEEKRFENADLDLQFDDDGNLVGMTGETEMPVQVSEQVSLQAGARTRVGYFSGAELNADENIDILLKRITIKDRYIFLREWRYIYRCYIDTKAQRVSTCKSLQPPMILCEYIVVIKCSLTHLCFGKRKHIKSVISIENGDVVN